MSDYKKNIKKLPKPSPGCTGKDCWHYQRGHCLFGNRCRDVHRDIPHTPATNIGPFHSEPPHYQGPGFALNMGRNAGPIPINQGYSRAWAMPPPALLTNMYGEEQRRGVDGQLYSKREFQNYYGNLTEWDRAKNAGRHRLLNKILKKLKRRRTRHTKSRAGRSSRRRTRHTKSRAGRSSRRRTRHTKSRAGRSSRRRTRHTKSRAGRSSRRRTRHTRSRAGRSSRRRTRHTRSRAGRSSRRRTRHTRSRAGTIFPQKNKTYKIACGTIFPQKNKTYKIACGTIFPQKNKTYKIASK